MDNSPNRNRAEKQNPAQNTDAEQLLQQPPSSSLNFEEPIDFAPVKKKQHGAYISILKNILPYLGSDEGKIILAEVMIALKVEGIIGKELTTKDNKMVHIIKDSILQEPQKKKDALRFAKRLLLGK